MGWGALSEGATNAPQLMEVNVDVVSQSSCNSAYQNAIRDTQICAGLPEGGADACQGDSGGPLVIGANTDAADVQVGMGVGWVWNLLMQLPITSGYWRGCLQPPCDIFGLQRKVYTVLYHRVTTDLAFVERVLGPNVHEPLPIFGASLAHQHQQRSNSSSTTDTAAAAAAALVLTGWHSVIWCRLWAAQHARSVHRCQQVQNIHQRPTAGECCIWSPASSVSDDNSII